MILTPKEQERMDRIIGEVTRPVPIRIYSDDALFLLNVIQRLANKLEELLK